ncbi:hypothetical protein AB0N07_32715 [Streptomyces sp. NPDC051172]|uniref:hypothetical protein n=1 Tax=Streptomyces sp. NPDC051172 TaxID=3155796 RepID=UPI003444CDDC
MTLIELDALVPAALADELAKRIYFISDQITDFTLIRSGDTVTAVDVTTQDPDATDLDALTRKLRLVVRNDVLNQRQVVPKVVWRSAEEGAVRDVFPELLTRGIAAELGEGQIALGEPVLSLMDYLDAEIRALVLDEFEAHEFRYPTLMSALALRRTGYFESFPQLLMLVSRLHGDVDSYGAFLDTLTGGSEDKDGDLAAALRDHTGDTDHVLPPTMCFHTYHQYADGPPPARNTVVTSRGKAFRYESRYRRSLERLWDFTIREVVFLGSPDFVLTSRSRLMELAFAFTESLGLSGRCEVAGDLFFLNRAAAVRAWSQRLLEMKYELRLPLEDERDVAVASFNYHEQFFGKSFDIRVEGERPVFTGCAGFGLERLAYAFLCRHGVSPALWPAHVRRAVDR